MVAITKNLALTVGCGLAAIPFTYFLCTVDGREREYFELALATCLSMHAVSNLIVMAMNEGLPSSTMRLVSISAVLLLTPAGLFAMPFVFPKEYDLFAVRVLVWVMAAAFFGVYFFVRMQILKEIQKKKAMKGG